MSLLEHIPFFGPAILAQRKRADHVRSAGAALRQAFEQCASLPEREAASKRVVQEYGLSASTERMALSMAHNWDMHRSPSQRCGMHVNTGAFWGRY